MKTKNLLYIAFIFIVLSSCTKDVKEPFVTPPTPIDASIKFSSDVYPIFTTYACVGCHGNSGGLTLSGTPSAVRANLLVNAVIPNNSATSKLFLNFNGGATHHTKTITATEVANIRSWIDSGALDN